LSTTYLTLRRPLLEYLGVNSAAVSKGEGDSMADSTAARGLPRVIETHRYAMLLRVR
jgi:hypothetical protein